MTAVEQGWPSAATVPPSRDAMIRDTLIGEIERMLDDLGNPPLVDRIFPNGWRNADDVKLASLYDLCRRTYQARAQASPPEPGK